MFLASKYCLFSVSNKGDSLVAKEVEKNAGYVQRFGQISQSGVVSIESGFDHRTSLLFHSNMDAAEFVVNSSSPPAEDENNERSSQEPSTEEAGNAEASANTVVDGDASATEGVAEEAAGSPQDGGSVLPSLSGWGFGSGFSWGKVMESGGRMMQTVKKQTEGVIDIYRKCVASCRTPQKRFGRGEISTNVPI